jgi:hypothetical protein
MKPDINIAPNRAYVALMKGFREGTAPCKDQNKILKILQGMGYKFLVTGETQFIVDLNKLNNNKKIFIKSGENRPLMEIARDYFFKIAMPVRF